MIDQSTIDRIIDTAQIVDVVSDFVSLKRRGANYIGLCPFHNEKTPSFSVSASKNICKCFSCGKGGNPVHFIMEHEQLSFFEALRYLAKKYNIEIQEKELSEEEKKMHSTREGMIILNSFAQSQFSSNLFDTDEGINVGMSYFHERGFRADIIKKFQLGYSLEQRDHFSQKALAQGFKKEYLVKTGLSSEGQSGQLFDRFRGRVIFPIHSISGKVKAFGGRILRNQEKMAKYVNSPESEIYHKSNELYGIFFAKQAINKQDHCFLVEGYTDVLAMHQAGIENVVASSGTALTPGQIRLIRRFTSNITVLYDGDAAGIKASIRGIDLILKEGMNVKVVLLPEGEDPDSFAHKNSSTQFLDYIEKNAVDFIRFKTSLLIQQAKNDPIKRAELITDVVRSIAIIPDSIVRSIYIKESSQLLEIGEEVLVHEVGKIIKEQLLSPQQDRDTPPPPPSQLEIPEAIPSAPSVGMSDIPAEASALAQHRPSPLDRFEFSIIRYIVRYGNKLLFEPQEDEESITVYQYIVNDLKEDEIEIAHPLYKRIFQEATKIRPGSNFDAYFVNSPDLAISKLAIDMVAEKYQLSKIHTKYATIEMEEDKLAELIPRAIFELKDAIIRLEILKINEKIKALTSASDPQELAILMQQLSERNQLRTLLAKELGERIINPLIR